tara:strand:- start:229 stop:1485 length:1257 start_codon:yes stop_codon:yes gene_type:complete
MSRHVAFVLKGYPRLSETFIAQEIRALERRGLFISIYSLRQPTDQYTHMIHSDIKAPIYYLPEYLHKEPLRLVRAWAALHNRTTYKTAQRAWLRDLWRDFTSSRLRRFGQALILAHELDSNVDQLHAHFLHTPASVTRYASILNELPWSCSAHAKDVWTIPVWEKLEKIASCSWLSTCNQSIHTHLKSLGSSESVHLNYHGIDLSYFSTNPHLPKARKHGSRNDPLILLSIGRTVEKKGHSILLDALAKIPKTLHWRLVHIGAGPLDKQLKHQAHSLGISKQIDWRGPLAHDAVLAAYRDADIFVLASCIGADGDRDGLPNVLVEAQSQSVPCVATTAGAIPELIEDGINGLLVPPNNPLALHQALTRLMLEPQLRLDMGRAGEQLIRAQFHMDEKIDGIAKLFGLPRHNTASIGITT